MQKVDCGRSGRPLDMGLDDGSSGATCRRHVVCPGFGAGFRRHGVSARRWIMPSGSGGASGDDAIPGPQFPPRSDRRSGHVAPPGQGGPRWRTSFRTGSRTSSGSSPGRSGSVSTGSEGAPHFGQAGLSSRVSSAVPVPSPASGGVSRRQESGTVCSVLARQPLARIPKWRLSRARVLRISQPPTAD